MSVVSVPFDDGAIGDGLRISLGLDASGEDWGGGCSRPECSEGLCHQPGERPREILGRKLTLTR